MSLSLRRRLLVYLLPGIVFVWLVSASAAAWQTYREAGLALDANLAHAASVILSLVAHEIEEHLNSPTPEQSSAPRPWINEIRAHLSGHVLDSPMAFQVSMADNAISFRSPGAPLVVLSDGANGYTDARVGERGWRVYTLRSPGLETTVRVGELHEYRRGLLEGLVRKLLLPLLVSVPLLAVFIWWSVGRGLAPLGRIAKQVELRDSARLEPLGIEHPPKDLAPLVSALDALFKRLAWALEGERRFTADASHELRTPLAGIRAQAQLACQATQDPQRLRALEQLLTGVDRATQLTEQLLLLSRLDSDPPERSGPRAIEPTDLPRLAQEVLAKLADQALAKHIDLSLESDASAWVALGAAELEVMLRNLVDNAIRYTPEQGSVSVEIRVSEPGVRMEITDNGPGIGAADREKVFRRFYRGRSVSASGSGLGLSIVARIAELAGARVQLRDAPTGGLSVVVDFPRGT